MNIDVIFSNIGGLGVQQWKYMIYLSLIHTYFPSQMLGYSFVGRTLSFSCVNNVNETHEVNSCPDDSSELCDVVNYDNSFETSIVSEWELVCDR
jgi:hypothetical protein